MDKSKFRDQARVLRNKRIANRPKSTKVKVSNKIVNIEGSAKNKPKDSTNYAQLNKAEIRRQNQENILKQQKELLKRKETKGCSKCKRKK